METGVDQAIENLRKLSVPALQKRYREVIGEPLRSSNKLYLFRRIAWRLQAQALGDLSERARRRATALASEADVPARQRIQAQPGTGRPVSALGGSRSQRDWRLPLSRHAACAPLPGTRCSGQDTGRRLRVSEAAFPVAQCHSHGSFRYPLERLLVLRTHGPSPWMNRVILRSQA